VPGWSAYYLDYKALKKIISALVANRAVSEATTALPIPKEHSSEGNLSTGQSLLQTQTSPGQPPLFSASEHHDEERGPVFQAQKAAFFFKLERELEKACIVCHCPYDEAENATGIN
jgi:CDK inhibitor PHO81